jgi:hypothetical protein
MKRDMYEYSRNQLCYYIVHGASKVPSFERLVDHNHFSKKLLFLGSQCSVCLCICAYGCYLFVGCWSSRQERENSLDKPRFQAHHGPAPAPIFF